MTESKFSWWKGEPQRVYALGIKSWWGWGVSTYSADEAGVRWGYLFSTYPCLLASIHSWTKKICELQLEGLGQPQ